MDDENVIVRIEGLEKNYVNESESLRVLKGLSLTIKKRRERRHHRRKRQRKKHAAQHFGRHRHGERRYGERGRAGTFLA